MSVGKRILRLRLEASKTQRDISDDTGLAVSYLSRLENGRITPTIPTLTKIAHALGVDVTAFFDQVPIATSADRCPVSNSGRCVMDQLLVGRGRRPSSRWEGYTPRQLELLRLCDSLLHTGDRQILSSLGTLLEGMVTLAQAKARAARRGAKKS
jgi:DNA-binding XRE family transcriptional regulator